MGVGAEGAAIRGAIACGVMVQPAEDREVP
jgi:hypothetical protein